MDLAGDRRAGVAVLIGGEDTTYLPAAGSCQRKGSQSFKGTLKGQEPSDSSGDKRSSSGDQQVLRI